MKRVLISAAVLGLLTAAGCDSMNSAVSTASSVAATAQPVAAAAGVDTSKAQPKIDLGSLVMASIPVKNAKVGDLAQYSPVGSTEWAVVGEKEGHLVVEQRLKYNEQSVVVAYLVDKEGKVKRAFGGLKDGIGAELKVPADAKGKSLEAKLPKTKELGVKDVETKAGKFSAKGVEMVEGATLGSKTWTSNVIPFLNGMVRMEDAAGNVTMELLVFKNDAKPTLNIDNMAAEKKSEKVEEKKTK